MSNPDDHTHSEVDFPDPENPAYIAQPLRSEISAPTQPEPLPTEQIDVQDSILYAWQMYDSQRGWNIIGIQTPQGQTLPMVTTSFDVAWQAFDIAQEHATKHHTRCRLAAFRFDTLMAVVLPDE